MKLANIFNNGKNHQLLQVILDSGNKNYKAVEAFMKANKKFMPQYRAHREAVGYPDTSVNAMTWELIDMGLNLGQSVNFNYKKAERYEARIERLLNEDYGLPCYATQDHANPGHC